MATHMHRFESPSTYALIKREQKQRDLATWQQLIAAGLAGTFYAGMQLISTQDDNDSLSKQIFLTTLVGCVSGTFFAGIKALKLYAEVKALSWINKTPAERVQSLLDVEEKEGLINRTTRASRAVQLISQLSEESRAAHYMTDQDQRVRAKSLASMIQ